MTLYPAPTVETQWRVVWFPPHRAQSTFTGTEDAVRRYAEKEHVAPWHPLIEKREVLVGAWTDG